MNVLWDLWTFCECTQKAAGTSLQHGAELPSMKTDITVIKWDNPREEGGVEAGCTIACRGTGRPSAGPSADASWHWNQLTSGWTWLLGQPLQPLFWIGVTFCHDITTITWNVIRINAFDTFRYYLKNKRLQVFQHVWLQGFWSDNRILCCLRFSWSPAYLHDCWHVLGIRWLIVTWNCCINEWKWILEVLSLS